MLTLNLKPAIPASPTNDAIIDQLEQRLNESYAMKFAALANEQETHIAWLRQHRSKPVNSAAVCDVGEEPLLVCDRDGLGVSELVPSPNRPAEEPLSLNASMKLADAVRAIVQSASTDGIKANDVIIELANIKHPISECSDFRKRVSSALCAMRSNGRPEALHPRSNKFRLYKDEETGRFFDPEAWNLRQA